ncbi:hypothetical protein [Deinococcus sp. QL22]|uniref:DarT1-associated NADAR antitoxin family protein n=1 Tax=Deinococcus sp. QL22 TaxID=2939437 RepID=UPI00201787F8|nr:hypothetical protein [Deinococcus sp. QL22]UQN08790.1 hypothetical protein M1R55_19480 [Deinococcus sp. QL22]
MAERPVFLPSSTSPFVQEKTVSFKWHAGLSRAQAQRSIAELHTSAAAQAVSPLLEISSKGSDPLGIKLSAFNLTFEAPTGQRLSVESAYQGSKVFQNGDHFPDLYRASSRDAKLDERVKGRPDIQQFDFFGEVWPRQPMTAFYDWLYLQALAQHPEHLAALEGYAGFTDIAFNPQKSSACQARCAAMRLGLRQAGIWTEALAGQQAFLDALGNKRNSGAAQPSLF